MTEETQEYKENLIKIFELMQEYRHLTLNSIEYILRWREFMAYPFLIHFKTDDKKFKNFITMPFFYEDQNYIMKVFERMICVFVNFFHFIILDENRYVIFKRNVFRESFGYEL